MAYLVPSRNKQRGRRPGFTLIELLVVIAIIGLLATLAIVAFGSARTKARDAKRKADIAMLQKALDMYYLSNGQYPASGGATSPNGGWTNSSDASWDTFKAALAPYISLPKDPINDTTGWASSGNFNYQYYSLGYGCNQKWYMLTYHLEDSTGVVSPGVTACDSTVFNYFPPAVTVGKRGE